MNAAEFAAKVRNRETVVGYWVVLDSPAWPSAWPDSGATTYRWTPSTACSATRECWPR